MAKDRTAVFIGSKIGARFMYRLVSKLNISRTFLLQGDLNDLEQRLVLERFSNAECGILFCTDILGRGMNLDIDYVIQYDPPVTNEVVMIVLYILTLGI